MLNMHQISYLWITLCFVLKTAAWVANLISIKKKKKRWTEDLPDGSVLSAVAGKPADLSLISESTRWEGANSAKLSFDLHRLAYYTHNYKNKNKDFYNVIWG